VSANASPPLRGAVAGAARALCRAGFLDAFGHVSARDGDVVQITPTSPLARVREDELLAVALDADASPVAGRPLETPLHLAIYRRRPDVGAIVRTHSRYAVLWGAIPAVPPLVHGLGALSGDVGLHRDPRLVADDAAAAAAATALGDGGSLLLAANGSLCVGADVDEALARAWYLEDRARVAWEVGERAQALTGERLAERRGHVAAELVRARAWAHDLVRNGDTR
jgi:ribulose-5-phosphate 4-epimerase/fuculose-1-phosphate aldolase